MIWKWSLVSLVLWPWIASCAFAAECGSRPAKAINLDTASTRSLLSPDRQWRFIGIAPKSFDQAATLSIRNTRSSRKWTVGSLERHGRAFWSDDSKRLFLRDQYTADDTKIRIFDFTGPVPKEIKGLDDRMRSAIHSRIPQDESTLWLYYPQVCFAENDSSMIIVVANIPVVRKRQNSEGKDFSLKLAVALMSLQVAISGPKAPRFPPSK
jgi:hypothetical protein